MAEEPKAAKASKSRLSGRELIQRAREQLEEMMGRPAESVLGMLRDGEGWKVTLEVVELQRVPASTDVLGSYEVEVDGNGDVIGYRRLRRYFRNRAGEG
jgi:Gas vesicle synthesis protein GvpO